MSSSRPGIIGYIILTLPSALARRMARSCSRKSSRSCKQSRMARQPRNGIHLGGSIPCGKAIYRPLRSNVRITKGYGLRARSHSAISLILLVLGGEISRLMKRYSVRDRANVPRRRFQLDLLPYRRLLLHVRRKQNAMSIQRCSGLVHWMSRNFSSR